MNCFRRACPSLPRPCKYKNIKIMFVVLAGFPSVMLVFSGTPTLTNGTFLTALEGGVGARSTYTFPPTPAYQHGTAHAPVMPVPKLRVLPSKAHVCALPGAPPDRKALLMQQPDAPIVRWSAAIRGEPELEYAQYAILHRARFPLGRKLALGCVGLLAVLVSGLCKLLPAAVGAAARRAVVHLRGHHAGPTAADVERTHVAGLFECTGTSGGIGRVRVEVGEMYEWTAAAVVATALCVLRDRAGGRVPVRSGCVPPVGGLGEPLVERLIAAGMKVAANP